LLKLPVSAAIRKKNPLLSSDVAVGTGTVEGDKLGLDDLVDERGLFSCHGITPGYPVVDFDTGAVHEEGVVEDGKLISHGTKGVHLVKLIESSEKKKDVTQRHQKDG
jgi:hypothetical protein